MKRRQFISLASLAALPAIPGCIEQGDSSGTGTPTETNPSANELPDSGFEATLTTTEECDLNHEVELLQPIPNHPDGPVELDVTVESTTDELLYYYPSEYTLLHQVSWGQFYLFRASSESEFNEDVGAWELTQPVPRIDQGVGEIEANEVIERTYVVLPSSNTGAEPVPNSLEFDASFVTSADPLESEEAKADADDCDVELSLTLTDEE